MNFLPCLSIRQPWAWLIIHGGKDVENRRWRTRFRGEFLIHTGVRSTPEDYEAALGALAMMRSPVRLPPQDRLAHGGIIGRARLVDCVRQCSSLWFRGPWGFVLTEARPTDFHPYLGHLRFFEVPWPPPLRR